MTNKMKFRKNRKLKSKMKGGKAASGPGAPAGGPRGEAASGPGYKTSAAPTVPPLPSEKDIPVAKAVLVKSKSGSSRGDYGSLNMQFFLYAVASIGVVGLAWLLISRSLIKHEYSETLSYGLVSLAVFLSFFLVIVSGLKTMRSGEGFVNGVKYLFKVVLFAITKCLPAILILIQCAVLIYITSKHANYLYVSDGIPALFNTFNVMAAVMIMGQSYVWWKQVQKIVLGSGDKYSNPALVPGFVLAAILSSIAISQMFVILEYLKTDC